jgi:hypothetical protein
MDDRLARRFYEGNILERMKAAEDNIALLQKLGLALQSYEDRVCSFDTKIGLVLSNNVSDANNDIDIAIGYCRDSTDGINIVSNVAATKRLDAAWTVGSGNGGLFSGSKANSSWYHVFIIEDGDGAIDWGFDTSITAANKPAGWTYHRRIGAVRTNGSGNIVPFYEYAGFFLWSDAITDLSGGNQTSPTLFTLTVPSGLVVLAIGSAYTTSNGNTMRVFNPNLNGTNLYAAYSSTDQSLSPNQHLTNTSSQLKYAVSSGTGTWYTYGWQELWKI